MSARPAEHVLLEKRMKRFAMLLAAVAVCVWSLNESALATVRVWGNTATDYNLGTSWTGGVAPGLGDVAEFNAAELTQPNLSASVSNAGLWFAGTATTGYDVTSTGGFTLTLTGYNSTGSSPSSNSSAAAIRAENTSGANTIDVALTLAPAGTPTGYSTPTSIFFQATGGTLVVNSVISGSGIPLSLKGAGTIQLNGNNLFSGGASIDQASTVLVVGNNGALGTGTFSINSTSTIQAGGAARTLANNVAFGGTTTISGSNAFTFNGAATTSGAITRTITVSNTGGTTFGGTFTIQGTTSPGIAVFNGTSAVIFNGVVQDGAAGPGLLRYSGSSTLTLNNSNTYSGGTQLTVSGANVIANHDGALGAGNVSLTAPGVTLTLQNGATNNYVNDNASISLVSTSGAAPFSVLNLNFTGTPDTVGNLIIDGVAVPAGTYNASNEPGFITGTGSLNVLAVAIPEPATYMLIGLGALVCAQQFRKRNKA